MRRAIAPLLALALALVLSVNAVAAVPIVQRIYRASLGTHGQAAITTYTNVTGTFGYKLIGMRHSTSYSAQIWTGTCAHLKTRVVTWTGFRTTSRGAATGRRNIAQATLIKIWNDGRTGPIAVRFVAGSSVVCANFGYVHATRVSIPSYKINLPVVPGPSSYPYCNVAMYETIMWQPNEPGVTFIYAHARTGMFLPLLTASTINNGAAMVGKLVYVYTSDSKVYTYKITQVRRHVKSVQSAMTVTTEHLWLQTSEGPNFTYPKLIIEGDRIAVAPTSYAAAHPTPHVVHCT
jgi:sortase (surface protein transpeptidase)